MIDTVFLLNKEANVLVEKQYRTKVERTEIDDVCLAIRDKSQKPPSITTRDNYTILTYQVGDLFLVGVCENDEFALISVTIMQYLGKLLLLFLKSPTDASVREDYTTVYQVLDYAVDFGYTYLNEPNTINTLLTRPKTDLSKGIRLQLDLERPWRAFNPTYYDNQLFVDVIECLDVVVSQFGRIEFSHIRGRVEMNCLLSGMPRLKLFLSNMTHYEDSTFHRCIEIENHDSKVIPFVPPDGKFTLMTYRVTSQLQSIPLEIRPQFTWSKGSLVFEITAKPDVVLQRPIENIEIRFELPDGVLGPSFTSTEGHATFEAATREVVWALGMLSPKTQATLRGSASTESKFELAGRYPVVSARFCTGAYVPSGFTIEHIDVENETYKAYRGVKYVTQSGNYEFRTGLT